MTQRPRFGCLFEIVETVVLTVIIAALIQTFVAQPWRVEQGSMEHTLEPDQYVLVDKLTPRIEPYQRGDVVVFSPPPGYERAGGAPFIKRVIGVSGDTVEIRDGGVFVNGTELHEPYLFAVTAGDAPEATVATQASWIVADGELFVLGDHRAVSEDSRTFGTIPIGSVIGRAWLRYWPLNVFGVLQTPTYQ